MLRLSFVAFALSVPVTIDAVAQQGLAPAPNETTREDGTIRYQLALTNLQLLTGAI
jgi:hypothetical protein